MKVPNTLNVYLQNDPGNNALHQVMCADDSGRSGQLLLWIHGASALVPTLKVQKSPAAVSLACIERGSISTVLYSVPNLSPSYSELDSTASGASLTQRSAVPVLLSLLLSPFPQETQPHQGYCYCCGLVDHLAPHAIYHFKMSACRSFLGLCSWLHNHWAPLFALPTPQVSAQHAHPGFGFPSSLFLSCFDLSYLSFFLLLRNLWVF